MKKLILGCLLALFASGCNDNEPEQKPVELKISFAGENPVEFTVGEQKRLAFTVTGDDLEGLTFAAEPDEALSGWTVVVSAGREGDAYAGALDVTGVRNSVGNGRDADRHRPQRQAVECDYADIDGRAGAGDGHRPESGRNRQLLYRQRGRRLYVRRCGAWQRQWR